MGTFFGFLALIGGIMGLIAYEREDKLEKRLEALEQELATLSKSKTSPSAKKDKENSAEGAKSKKSPRQNENKQKKSSDSKNKAPKKNSTK